MAFFYKLSIFLIALQTAFFFTTAQPIKIIQMPESCSNMTYCTNPENYPVEVIQNLLKQNFLNLKVITPATPGPEVNQRDYDDEDFIDIGCKRSTSRLPIYYIRDENDDVRVVLQSSEIFTQIIQIRECAIGELKNTRSDAFTQDELENLDLHCENLTLDYNFLVLSKDFSSLELVKVKGGLPVDCVCRTHKLS